MTFLFIVSSVAFFVSSSLLLLIVVGEVTKTTRDREVEALENQLRFITTGTRVKKTYMNKKMFMLVVLWVAAGTFIFW